MSRLIVIIALAMLVLGGFALAPTSNQPPKTTADNSAASKVTIITDKGEIVIELFRSDAPQTVNNFLSKVTAGDYNGRLFHRVEDWVVQGGDPLGNGTGGGKLATELSSRPFGKGAVGVARGNDISVSNDAQFFLVKTDAPWLNGQYTNFGQVLQGLEVVARLEVGDKIRQITIN